LVAGNTGATYLWNTGETTETIDVTLAGNYAVDVDLNECIVTNDFTVEINQLPVVVAHASNVNVCLGEQVVLTGFGANAYIWNNGVTDGVGINPIGVTTYTVTGTDANGCENTAEVIITVDQLPVVVANASDTSVCLGGGRLC